MTYTNRQHVHGSWAFPNMLKFARQARLVVNLINLSSGGATCVQRCSWALIVFMGPIKVYGSNQGLWVQSRFMGPIKVYESNQKFMGPIKNFNPRPPWVEKFQNFFKKSPKKLMFRFRYVCIPIVVSPQLLIGNQKNL